MVCGPEGRGRVVWGLGRGCRCWAPAAGEGAGLGWCGGQSRRPSGFPWGSLLAGQPGCGPGPAMPAALEGRWGRPLSLYNAVFMGVSCDSTQNCCHTVPRTLPLGGCPSGRSLGICCLQKAEARGGVPAKDSAVPLRQDPQEPLVAGTLSLEQGFSAVLLVPALSLQVGDGMLRAVPGRGAWGPQNLPSRYHRS